jgi:hypothetical protein
MQLASPLAGFPRPAALPTLAVTPKIDLAKDVVVLDGTGNRRLPREIAEGGVHLDIDTTSTDEEGDQITDWYAADSEYDSAYRMTRGGFSAALAAAQLLSPEHEALAVVQSAKTGTRYLVPLGVWDPVDESQLSFEDAGGTPYYTSAKDHLLVKSTGTADVEAVVFNHGAGWVNTTGHPVKLPTA